MGRRPASMVSEAAVIHGRYDKACFTSSCYSITTFGWKVSKKLCSSRQISLPRLHDRRYQFTADATLIPFADLDQRWKNFGQYKSCIEQAMNDLAHEGLYDKQIGNGSVFTGEVLSLFRH